jgi:UDP-N-acetylmuramate dehydrogenase
MYAHKSGEAVVELLRQGITARDILTKPAFENAIAVVMAFGGSTNAVLHLLAIAHEADVDLQLADFGYSYRHSHAPQDIIWVEATYRGTPDDPAAVLARMEAITARRETTQPIRDKTGGSTFKNPPGDSSWRLVDAAGWRGRLHGGAKFSELHSNFMINTGEATAADLEGLGDAVRADVKARFDVELDWEIRRIGRPG